MRDDVRFWAKVDKQADHWFWRGQTDRKGYGLVGRGPRGRRTIWRAHRYVWTLAHGPIPEGLSVCHHCDLPPCVRPDHLFLGTNADNTADMMAKGRHRSVGGEAHYKAKLTEAAVRQIRARYTGKWGEQSALAREFGVSQGEIWHIVTGRHWKSVS